MKCYQYFANKIIILAETYCENFVWSLSIISVSFYYVLYFMNILLYFYLVFSDIGVWMIHFWKILENAGVDEEPFEMTVVYVTFNCV